MAPQLDAFAGKKNLFAERKGSPPPSFSWPQIKRDARLERHRQLDGGGALRLHPCMDGGGGRPPPSFLRPQIKRKKGSPRKAPTARRRRRPPPRRPPPRPRAACGGESGEKIRVFFCEAHNFWGRQSSDRADAARLIYLRCRPAAVRHRHGAIAGLERVHLFITKITFLL